MKKVNLNVNLKEHVKLSFSVVFYESTLLKLFKLGGLDEKKSRRIRERGKIFDFLIEPKFFDQIKQI